MERSSEIVLLMVLRKIYFLLSLRGCARQDVHVEIEVPLGMFLPTGTL